MTQKAKAERFRALHHDRKLLVLPNIWDPLGARLLEGLGYPAVATASAAIAYSLGYADGQRITFASMLDVIRRVASSVEVPVSADLERGYAESPEDVAANVREALHAGAVGINLEDGLFEGGPLCAVGDQCERIRAVRRMADGEGIPLVINARTDVFLGGISGSRTTKIAEAVARGKAYREAGADCLYPIGLDDLEALRRIRAEAEVPLNVYAKSSTASSSELEAAGVSRVSLGPGLIRASLTVMRDIALALRSGGSFASFTDEAMTSDEVEQYVRLHAEGKEP